MKAEDELQGHSKIDSDMVLSAMGRFGKYQLMVYCLCCLVDLAFGPQIMSMAFANAAPPFTCKQMVQMEPVSFDGNCSYWNNATQTTEQCKKFIFEKSFGNTIVSEWDIVCEWSSLSQLPGSVFMAGMLFGAILITQLSDRFGRRWSFLINLWLLGVAGVGTSFAPSFSILLALRFFTGFFLAGCGMVGWVLCCETVSKEMRSFAPFLDNLCWTIGYCLTGVMAYFIRDWRMLYLAGSLPIFLSLSYYWLIPESLHWLVAQNRTEEAEAWIAKASKWSGVQLRHSDFLVQSDGGRIKQRSVIDIFKNKVLAVQTLLMAYIWANHSFVYYGLSLFSTQLSGNRYVNFILLGVVEVPCVFLTPFLLHHFGRRLIVAVYLSLVGVALFSLALLPSTAPIGAQIGLSMVGKFCITSSYNGVFLLVTEIFPTKVRNVGCGFCSMSARIGSIVAPYASVLGDVSPSLPPGLFAGMSVLGAFFVCCLPETRGVELAEDIDDTLVGPLMRWCTQRRTPKETSRPENIEMLSSAGQIT